MGSISRSEFNLYVLSRQRPLDNPSRWPSDGDVILWLFTAASDDTQMLYCNKQRLLNHFRYSISMYF